MAKDKKVALKNVEVMPGFYKGYDIRWLRELPEHPDYKLVAEYDQLQKKGK